jgi:hypothetical protein
MYRASLGARGGAVVWGTALQAGRSRFRFLMVSLEFFIHVILPAHHGPGVDSASNRNEYQEYFLGGKDGRCVGLTTLPPSCAVVLKSRSLIHLELSGPVQACNGIALPYSASFVILYHDQQMQIISQIITLLHVSTLSFHPQRIWYSWIRAS